MKEKEIIEKEEEKFLELMGFPLHTTMPSHADARAVVYEIMNTTASSNLIPRRVNTTIAVYPFTTVFNADLLMQLQNNTTTNFQGIPNNTSNGGSNINNNAVAEVRAAIESQNQGVLRIILETQPDLIKATDEKGLTPLSYAASKGFEDIVVYFLDKYPETIYIRNKDKLQSYPIHMACLGGHVRVLEMFHSKFPSPLSSVVDNQGQTILHVAARERGNKLKHVVEYLLRLPEGIKLINKMDEMDCTPLDLARSSKNGEVEQLIMEKIMR
ncbi:uncharacterized protein LOC110697098 [Chenopodium quinoa]|uniref:Uncharacterized protein n=1 Tax=Chenopodium quinoa TaxID=63459 RepID=A0A803KVY5_CHEQI|nr:uncharacterized protein LOC110697098 [Chenopodium quinoa]